MSAIVLGYDSSPGSRAALEAATQLAGGLAAKLVIVYGYGAPGSNLSGDEIAAHRAALADEGKSLTGDAQRHAQDAGVESEVELVDERPTDALLEVAAKHSARLHRGRGLRREPAARRDSRVHPAQAAPPVRDAGGCGARRRRLTRPP